MPMTASDIVGYTGWGMIIVGMGMVWIAVGMR